MNDTVALRDIAEIRGRVGWKGYTVEDLVDEGPLVVGANDITTDNQLDLTNVKHLTRKKYEESPEIFIKKNDILVVKVGSTIGKVCIIDQDIGESSINPNCVIVRPTNIDSYYLYCYLCSPAGKAYLLNNSSASGQPALNQKDLGDMPVPMIGINEQIRITKIIHNINKKIRNNNEIVSKIDEIAKSIYNYWFLQFEFPNEDGKPYKSSGGKMVWNDELKREIPEGWNVTNVGNITTCLDSKRVPLSSKDRENMKGPYPYYGATSKMDSVNEYLFDGDYVLLAEDGSVMDDNGFPILQRTSGKVWINNHAHVLQPKKPYGCKLLMFILKNIPVSMIKTGSIQMKVNQENLNAFKVLSIPENLIEKANSILNPIDAKIIMLKQENQELISLRDFLLPMLMNGQTVIND